MIKQVKKKKRSLEPLNTEKKAEYKYIFLKKVLVSSTFKNYDLQQIMTVALDLFNFKFLPLQPPNSPFDMRFLSILLSMRK